MSAYIPKATRSDWRTPPEVIDHVRAVFDGQIDLDPCAPPDPAHTFAKGNLAGPAGSPSDGLSREWSGRVFVNPPFDALSTWAAKCAAEHQEHGAEVILLLPARTDTRFWHGPIATSDAICFLRGRLRFVGAEASCPFPTALVYWGPRPWRFHEVFSAKGMVVTP